ncbi:hypothetical protein K4L06_00345 [Lysobacter sp. BMK333-48F3]|uniref:hypothetical protein n=1 Tax=Lysobacter sp. BMK333-48F3 TaxID=2867962 RepID=UPI001C8C3206|nr:hypothetical protein [Lysobacter sp. BMK333-48F3]MBX9399740.1 hypothetical protein [Lysobacter sp. BMK333-48F3]
MRAVGHRQSIESGRTSQAAGFGFVSTDRNGSQVAPAARMERGSITDTVERAGKSAPALAGRVPFGLHLSGLRSPGRQPFAARAAGAAA